MQEAYSSIKTKLVRVVLVTSGVVLFLTCAAFFTYEFFTYRQTTKEQLSTLGKIIAANSTAALAFQSQNDANEMLQALKAESHVVAACLYDEEGNIFAKYPETLTESEIPKHPQSVGYRYNQSYLEGFQPVIQQEKRVGTLYLRSDMKAIYQRFKLYTLVTVLVIIIVVCVVHLVSGRLQRTILIPILALAKTAGAVSNKKDYSVRSQKFYNDEVGELTDAFNQMLAQIEQQNAEIISFNQALEVKVTRRTNQLEVANLELKLKNEFVEKIIDSSVDVIAVFDKDLNYVMLNKYAKQVYGVHLDHVIGKNVLEVFPQMKNSQMYSDLSKSLRGELIHNHYYRSPLSNKILENFYIPLLDSEGNIYNVVFIGHDITQIIESNEKLSTLNKELESSNRDLEQFAYVASHDLQEPLRKIQTYSSLLEQQLDDKDASLKYLSRIISSVRRMRELITSILNYSQTSHIHGRSEQVNLNEIIENIKVDYELSIEEKQASITATRLPLVEGDKLQLSQLFLNLISNSLKFSRKKPEIFIFSSVVEREEIGDDEIVKPGGRFLKLIFKDNGIGFDQQFSEKVFTIFQRLHNRKDYEGTGIGLALCKKIVENHGGHISVTSVVGEGTTFTIYLPLLQ